MLNYRGTALVQNIGTCTLKLWLRNVLYQGSF